MEELTPDKRAARVRLRALFSCNENRDDIIRQGFDAGFKKAELTRMSGLSRSTIDRILDGPAPSTEAGQ
jgi:hypothetical protein